MKLDKEEDGEHLKWMAQVEAGTLKVPLSTGGRRTVRTMLPVKLNKVANVPSGLSGVGFLSLNPHGNEHPGMFDFEKATLPVEVPRVGGLVVGLQTATPRVVKPTGSQTARSSREQPRRSRPTAKLVQHPIEQFSMMTSLSVHCRPRPAGAPSLEARQGQNLSEFYRRGLHSGDPQQRRPPRVYTPDADKANPHPRLSQRRLVPEAQTKLELVQDDSTRASAQEADSFPKELLERRRKQVHEWLHQRQICVANVQKCMHEIQLQQSTDAQDKSKRKPLTLLANRMRYLISELQGVTLHTTNAVRHWQATWCNIEGNGDQPPPFLYQGKDLVESLPNDLNFLKKSYMVRQWINDGSDDATEGAAPADDPNFFLTTMT